MMIFITTVDDHQMNGTEVEWDPPNNFITLREIQIEVKVSHFIGSSK